MFNGLFSAVSRGQPLRVLYVNNLHLCIILFRAYEAHVAFAYFLKDIGNRSNDCFAVCLQVSS